MRILSFGWTADKLLAGKKTVTRRKWKKAWVQPGDLVQAWDKGPHRGGRRLGTLKILKVTKLTGFPWRVTQREAEKEGFTAATELLQVLLDGDIDVWSPLYRIEFEIVGKLS
jgi:hypothetical protein